VAPVSEQAGGYYLFFPDIIFIINLNVVSFIWSGSYSSLLRLRIPFYHYCVPVMLVAMGVPTLIWRLSV